MKTNKEQFMIMEIYEKEEERGRELMCRRLDPTVKSIMNRHHVPPQMREDAYQEGMIAVIENLARYEPDIASPETFFSVYILHSINKYLKETLCFSSLYHSKKISLVSDIENRLVLSGIKPTISAIAEAGNLSEEDVKQTKAHMDRIQQHKFKEEDTDITDGFHDTEADALKNIRIEKMHKALKKLGKRQGDILAMNYGLYGEKKQPVRVIAEKYHVPDCQIRKEIWQSLALMKYMM